MKRCIHFNNVVGVENIEIEKYMGGPLIYVVTT
jgi:hypothetical protein